MIRSARTDGIIDETDHKMNMLRIFESKRPTATGKAPKPEGFAGQVVIEGIDTGDTVNVRVHSLVYEIRALKPLYCASYLSLAGLVSWETPCTMVYD